MHEETRRQLLRAAFVLLCLVPTVGVLGWTLVRSLPVQTRRLEQQLRQQLGIVVRIGRLSHPRPRQLYLEDVTLLDIESQRPLAQVSRLNAQATEQGWRLVIPEMTMSQASLPALWQTVHQRLVREDALADRIAHIAVTCLTLEHVERQLTLHDVNWARARQPDVQRSQLFFALEDSSPSQGVRVDLHRDRSADEPMTRLTVDTGEISLPLSLVAILLGHDWQTNAQFRGKLPVVWQDGHWNAQFVGQLSGLNLSDLSPNWIAYDVQGTATMNIHQCDFDRRGLQLIRGGLIVNQLAMPPAFVQSLMKLELLTPGPAYEDLDHEQPLALAQFGVEFALGEMGLGCRGIADDAGLLVAAVNDAGPVLLCNGHVRVDWLICALLPETVENVYQARARLMDSLPATLPRL